MSDAKQPDFFSSQILEARRFYLDLTPPPSASLAVVCGGCEHCSQDYEIHRKDFPFYSIEFVAKGKGTLGLGGKNHRLIPGTLYSYGPGISQDIVSNPEDRLVKYFVDFAGTQAPKLLRELGLAPGTVIQTTSPAEIIRIFDDLIRDGLRETPYTQKIATVLLRYMLLKIAETAIEHGAAATTAFLTYQKCKLYLDEHWREIRSLNRVSVDCHVASAHLCRLFRRFAHQSPYQYLLRLKMQYAAQRLESSGGPVKLIADEVGFSDPYHFSRVFKSVIGASPSYFTRLGKRAA